jgi:hypothetical protein
MFMYPSAITAATAAATTIATIWLFPTLKMGLKGMRLTTMEGIKSNATAKLQKIPKEAFRQCFQQ